MEREVWEKIVKWLNHPDEIAAAAEDMAEGQTSSFEELEINQLEAEIERAKEGRKRLLNLFAQGLSISEDEIRESIRDLKEKEDELRERLEKIKEIMKERERERYTVELIREAAEYYLSKQGCRIFLLSLSNDLSGHFSAFIRTLSADVRTFLTVCVLEFGAFLSTSLTDSCAQFTNLSGVIAVSGHIARSDGANFCTIPEHLNTVYPGLYIRFIQTRC